jgi:hypothetical protein
MISRFRKQGIELLFITCEEALKYTFTYTESLTELFVLSVIVLVNSNLQINHYFSLFVQATALTLIPLNPGIEICAGLLIISSKFLPLRYLTTSSMSIFHPPQLYVLARPSANHSSTPLKTISRLSSQELSLPPTISVRVLRLFMRTNAIFHSS